LIQFTQILYTKVSRIHRLTVTRVWIGREGSTQFPFVLTRAAEGPTLAPEAVQVPMIGSVIATGTASG